MTNPLRKGLGQEAAIEAARKLDEKRRTMAEVFATPSGERVLCYLLEDLGYFDPCTTAEQIALHNYAARLVGFLGGTRDTLAHTRKLIALMRSKEGIDG